jgi:hypothetical protein
MPEEVNPKHEDGKRIIKGLAFFLKRSRRKEIL